MPPTYWRTLLSLLFARSSAKRAGSEAPSAKLAAIGIDAAFRSRFAEQIRPETSALIVLVIRPAIRDKVLGVLPGSQGEIMRTALTGDNREVWLHCMLGTEQLEKMK